MIDNTEIYVHVVPKSTPQQEKKHCTKHNNTASN